MEARRPLGWLLLVAGGVLILIAIVWGRSGFSGGQAPILLLFVVGGAVSAAIGGRLLRKPKQDDEPVRWRSPGPGDDR